MEILYILLFVLGLVCLLKGADIITDYASRIARALGVSEMVIGLTLVAMATSLPELAVVITSALTNIAEIATGTIIGSNIANIGLVLGISSLSAVFFTTKEFLRQAYIMFAFSLMVALFFIDGFFWFEGIILISLIIIYMYWIVKIKAGREQSKNPKKTHEKIALYLLLCVLGGIAVVAGANFIVTSTVGMASWFGVSEMMISLVIIAVGTSLPELVTSIVAAKKNMRGISLGNIIGSNIFNFMILGISSLIAIVPTTINLLLVNIPIMLILSLLLVLFIKTERMVTKKEGTILIIVYAIFITLQFLV